MPGINDLRGVNRPGRNETGVFFRQPSDTGPAAACGSLQTGFAAIVVLFCMLQPILLHSSTLASAGSSSRSSLRPGGDNGKISDAFAKYVRATNSRNNSELQRGKDLLWVDSLPEVARDKAYADLSSGELQLEQRTTRESGRQIACPECMIHHWEGLVFIPGARLDDVLGVLEDYDHHAEYYAPDVVRSEIEARDGDHYRVFLRFRRQKVITVVLNTEHEINYYRDSAVGAHSRSSATHVAEVENPGKPKEREKPREEDNGFLWGMETWWRMEERDNGVYVQSEVVSLSRDVPAGLGWMIGPLVTAVPKESLTFTLEATRKAVLARLHAKKNLN
jgi:hypothetical protein